MEVLILYKKFIGEKRSALHAGVSVSSERRLSKEFYAFRSRRKKGDQGMILGEIREALDIKNLGFVVDDGDCRFLIRHCVRSQAHRAQENRR